MAVDGQKGEFRKELYIWNARGRCDVGLHYIRQRHVYAAFFQRRVNLSELSLRPNRGQLYQHPVHTLNSMHDKDHDWLALSFPASDLGPMPEQCQGAFPDRTSSHDG